MTALLQALRARYRSPQAALAALGLDAALLEDIAKETPMSRSRVARLARDQEDLPARSGLQGQPKPNLDQDDPTNGTAPPPDSDELLALIKLCMAKMPDQQDFLEKLAELVSTASSGAGAVGAGDQGAPNNNLGAIDRRRFGARDQRPAQDLTVRVLNHQSFMKRFDYLQGVDVWR